MQLLAQSLTHLSDRLSHLKSKVFKGRLIDTHDSTYGRVHIYESGYVEFIDYMTGDKSEPMKDIYHVTYAWRVTSTDGSTVNIGRYRRANALREAESLVGRVLYVDDTNKIIFCKTK